MKRSVIIGLLVVVIFGAAGVGFIAGVLYGSRNANVAVVPVIDKDQWAKEEARGEEERRKVHGTTWDHPTKTSKPAAYAFGDDPPTTQKRK